jgi:dTMP kinase
MASPGRLITIEGIDGVGKTTLAAALSESLGERGIDCCLLREPGGVELSERLRSLVKDPALAVGPRAEALIYAAARAQLVDEAIRPRLAAGQWVLLDRFVDSSLAYQGAGRRLGVEQIAELNAFATGGLAPDRTLLLSLEPEAARVRARARAEAADRLELEAAEFFQRAHSAYLRLAAAEPGRVRVVQANDPPEQVLAHALAALDGLI